MKKLLSSILLLALIFTLSACADKVETSQTILKASFSSSADTFAYCFTLTDDGVFTTKYGPLETDKLESDNYIKDGKEKSINLSDKQKSELLNLADEFYENKSAMSGDGTDGAININVLYKDTQISTCYDTSDIAKSLGENLIALSPLEVDLSIANGAEMDLIGSKWICEEPSIELESINDDVSCPKFKMTVKDKLDSEKTYYINFDGANGQYSNGTYSCIFTFNGSSSEDIENSDLILSGDGEYLGDEMIFNGWGKDDIFNFEYETITFKRVEN